MRITISEDVTFLIIEGSGDVFARTEMGLYHEDTRYLSLLQLTIDGQEPVLLASRAIATHQATVYLTNPTLTAPSPIGLPLDHPARATLAEAGAVPRGAIAVVRELTLGDRLTETLTFTNYGATRAAFTIELRIEADFAHVFDVKNAVEVSGAAAHGDGTFTRIASPDGLSLRFRMIRPDAERLLDVSFSRAAIIDAERVRFPITLVPGEPDQVTIRYQPINPAETRPVSGGGASAERTRERLALIAQAPQLHAANLVLQQSYAQSVRDFAALQLRDPEGGRHDSLIAAGIPWFMTLFGRDALITAYQALPFFPETAQGVLRALARRQGTQIDLRRMEEPGKILHEARSPSFIGKDDSANIFPYYGTVDATPLFIMVLAAVFRVTGDLAFVHELRGNLVRALEWIDRYGDRDGDGFIEYLRETPQGLANHGWKDSGDSIRFRDGRLATAPIALAEVQGYAYAARHGAAEIFDALGDPAAAATQRARAAELRARFNQAFWMPERGYFALALDGAKRQVDALTSNPGQLLWTGIVDAPKAQQVARALVGPELFAGWGVRTMAAGEGAYNPISYHNGSIWPHDNSLIVHGLARYGFVSEAAQITAGLLSALEFSPDARLPELFAGFHRDETGYPVEYPTACRPQAWAAGAIFLLLSAMVGYDASMPQLRATPFLVPDLATVELAGLMLAGERVSIAATRAEDGEGVHQLIKQLAHTPA